MDPAQVFGDQSSASSPAAAAAQPAATGFTPAATETAPTKEGNGEGDLTPEQVRAALTHALKQNQDLEGELGNLKKAGASQGEIIGKMKQVFNPEEEDPVAAAKANGENFLDMVLQAAQESERAGTGGMPITVQLAAHMVQMQNQSREQQAVIDKLTGQMKQQTDPRYETENRAAMNLDTMVGQMIGNIYGAENPHMFKAVTGKMLEDISTLREKDPAKWMEIARNPAHQKQVAQWYVEQFVPPKARELLHHQKVMDTPMSRQELYQAYNEVGEAYKEKPEEGRRIKEQIRQQILVAKYDQAMPGSRR